MNYLELGHICEGEGAQGVVLHARTAKQMFRGEAAWPHIARLKEERYGSVRVPLGSVQVLLTVV